MRFLVTGGAGFIGSALLRRLINELKIEVLNIDKLTYAANLNALENVVESPLYNFLKADINDRETIRRAFQDFQPTAVLHLAAESHVDRSIENSNAFIQTNICGTHALLQEALLYWEGKNKPSDFRFIHVSTDEVYGTLSLNDNLKFTENTPYQPNSPYSASKASSDLLARAWYRTYGLPVIITHCSNNYGRYQYSEKLIPLMISFCLEGKDLPVYGTGENVRDWIYVDDHVKGILKVLKDGKVGKTYNMGGENEIKNINLVEMICEMLDELSPRYDKKSYKTQITFVKDRLGHDFRYAIDNTKIQTELGWEPSVTFEEGLKMTVSWYVNELNKNRKGVAI